MQESNRTDKESSKSRHVRTSSVSPRGGIRSRQGVLSPIRQLTLEGKEEPLCEPAPEIEPESDPLDSRQLDLSSIMQGALPLHPKVNGQANPECFKDKNGNSLYSARVDPSGKQETRFYPCVCGRKGCQSSETVNSKERAKILWDGTARKGNRKIGVRHALGHDVKLISAVITHSEKQLIQLVRMGPEKACKELRKHLLCELRQMIADHVHQDVRDILLWEKQFFHPTGDKNPDRFRGHWNFMFSNYYYSKNTGRAHRFDPFIPNIGKVMKRYVLRALERVFGMVDESEVDFVHDSPDEAVVDPKKVNCHWQFHCDEEVKRHQVNYMPRLEGFSQWGFLCLRPVTSGLAHPKNKENLETSIESLKIKPLPEWLSGQECIQSARGYSEEQAEESAQRAAEFHRKACSKCLTSYTYFRHTMRLEIGSSGSDLSFLGLRDPIPIQSSA